VNLKAPNFKRDQVAAPIFGTIMHEVMMHLLNDWKTFSNLKEADREDYIQRLIQNIEDRETFLTAVHVKKIHENVIRFISDDTMMGLLNKQKQIHTEIPFIMNQQAIGYSEYESQIVQGIMDCLLEIDGHYTIIDYKTDWIPPMSTEEDLADRYRTQMDI